MAQVIPSTPDPNALGTRRTRAPTVAIDKENLPPSRNMPSTPAGGGGKGGHGEASTPARSACITPASKLGVGGGGRHLMSTPHSVGKAPAAMLCTPSGHTGSLPKSLDEWYDVLTALPTSTVSDKARLFRLYERALGSGEGSEELDVASHKENEAYIALWLQRIRLDPDEGASYIKFMRKWHIGRKCAAVYIQQALAAPEKAGKSLQEGIDASAQPAELLSTLQDKISGGQSVEEACSEVLEGDKHAGMRGMLGLDAEERKGVAAAAEADTGQFGKRIAEAAQQEAKAKAATAAATPAAKPDAKPKVELAAIPPFQNQQQDKHSPSETNDEAPADDSTAKVTSRRSTRRAAAKPEETVVFATPRAAASKAGAGDEAKAAAAKSAGGGVKRSTGLRGIKRTGLGSTARRVIPGQEPTEEAPAEGSAEENAKEPQPTTSGDAGQDSHKPSVERAPLGDAEAARSDSEAPVRHTGKRMVGSAHVSSLSGAGCSLSIDEEVEGSGVSSRSNGDHLHDMPTRPLANSELASISESEGGSGSGSDGNSSISSGGSNDSVNHSVDHPSAAASASPKPSLSSVVMSDQTTKPQQLSNPNETIANDQTQPLRKGGEEESGTGDLFFKDEEEHAPEGSKRARQIAMCKGHTSQIPDEQVPKGHIAVCGKVYKKIEVKGKGGGGKVYKVHLREKKDEIWAIKKIKLSPGDEEVRDSVFNEIELLLRLRGHTSIIHMEDYEIGDDYVYMVMECGDLDLAQALQKRQVRSLRGVWRAMIEAVQVVHDERVVHGDLKPANFLMVKKELKLIDFGIAKQIESNDTTNIVRDNAIGTLNYMAPEAFLGNQGASMGRKTDGALKLGRPSDVWSLGCILYQMVYGKPPFHNLKNTVHKMQAITSASHAIDFPSVGASGAVEPDLLDVLKATLEKDPVKRPTIPHLRSHPWLVPVKYALDGYNILVMVSKVRALHKEHKDISDNQIKDELVRLMNSAGLAIQEPPPALPPKSAPPAPPPPPQQMPPPPPPPPPPAPGPTSAPAPKQAAAVITQDVLKGAAGLRSAAGSDHKAPPSSSSASGSGAAGVPSQSELLAQRNKLKKVQEGSHKPAEVERDGLEGALREKMEYMRSRVGQDLTGNAGNTTGDFTSDFTKTAQMEHQ